MTLLGSLVEASDRVSAASARLSKVRELAQFLRTLEPSELAAGVLYLSGEVPQGRCGIGQTALRAADTVAAASTPSLSLAEVDQKLAAIASLVRQGRRRTTCRRAQRTFRAGDRARTTVPGTSAARRASPGRTRRRDD